MVADGLLFRAYLLVPTALSLLAIGAWHGWHVSEDGTAVHRLRSNPFDVAKTRIMNQTDRPGIPHAVKRNRWARLRSGPTTFALCCAAISTQLHAPFPPVPPRHGTDQRMSTGRRWCAWSAGGDWL